MIAIFIILFWLFACPLWAASDNFNRGDETLTSGDWAEQSVGSNLQIVTNQVTAVSSNAGDARYAGFTPAADQTASITIATMTAGFVAVLLRVSGQTFYAIGCTTTDSWIWSTEDGFKAVDTAPVGCTAGDTITGEALGSTITLKKNGNTVLSPVDNYLSSGSCGLRVEYESATTDAIVDDFTCSSLGGGGPTPKHRVVMVE